MSDNNELFPFPTVAEADKTDKQAQAAAKLPEFPGEPDTDEVEAPLTSAELREIRTLLASQRAASTKELPPLPSVDLPLPASTPAVTNSTEAQKPEKILQQQFIAYLESLQLKEPFELEARRQLTEIIATISDARIITRVWAATGSILPIKSSLRHGTPDQKLFALIMLGERFLQSLSAINFTDRKRLLKAVARYLSEVSETCSFIQMEGEPFNPQYHERAPGSMPSGKSVREMHGFLVTSRSSNQVVKTALVLT